MTGRHSAKRTGDEPPEPSPGLGPSDPIAPRPAWRVDPAEPTVLPEAADEPPGVGLSLRMFLVSLGIGVASATALSLAALLPR